MKRKSSKKRKSNEEKIVVKAIKLLHSIPQAASNLNIVLKNLPPILAEVEKGTISLPLVLEIMYLWLHTESFVKIMRVYHATSTTMKEK